MKVNVIVITMLLALAYFCPGDCVAQRKPPLNSTKTIGDIKPRGCERNNIILEQAHHEAGADSIVILIARPGIKDKRRDIVGKRLYTARVYLTEYLVWRSGETIVVGEAPNNGSDYGVVEIYVKGQLFDVLANNPDAELGLGSCDSPDSDDRESRVKRALLYPWLYKKK